MFSLPASQQPRWPEANPAPSRGGRWPRRPHRASV